MNFDSATMRNLEGRTNPPLPTATLDTNVLVEFWRDRRKASITRTLLDLAKSGFLDLAITSRIREDIPHPPLADLISELRSLQVQQIGSVFVLGLSGLGGGDMLADDEFPEVMEQIEELFDRQGRVKNRPDWRDWQHVWGHYLKKRDVFLTWDQPILVAAVELKAHLGIKIMEPEQFLTSFS